MLLDHFYLTYLDEAVAWSYNEFVDMPDIDPRLNRLMRAEKYDSGQYARITMGLFRDMWE